VFQTDEEYRVISGDRTLGTVPLDATLAPGQTIIFSGRRWRIESIDDRAKALVVAPTTAALPPQFGGDGAGVHDRVAAAMRACLSGTHVPPFLDAGARSLLDQARGTFFELGLDRGSIVEVGRDCVIFPWVGGTKLDTLALALMARGFKATPIRHAVEVRACSAESLRAIMTDMVREPPPDGAALARLSAKPLREKYDVYLTEDLLTAAMAMERLDAPALPMVARLVLEPPA
jgi:ATP-dependent Lhr-like helicase